MPEDSLRVEFPNGRGQRLAARLDKPAGVPIATAVFAHCFTCSKDILAASRVSRALAARGIAVLRFDFTGLGHSEGEFANTNFSSNVADVVAAADYLRETYAAPRLLIGHSLGGAAVLVTATRVPEVDAIVTIGAPGDPSHVERLFADERSDIESSGEAIVTIAGRSFRIQKQFLDDLAEHSLKGALADYRGALLILHSPTDSVVGVDQARVIYESARHPKSFIALDGADHLLTDKADARFVADVVSTWVDRYVCQTCTVDGASAPEADGGVLVRDTGTPYHQEVRAGRHVLAADEPEKVGGGDVGPSPYEYLLAALGTCTSMTLRMYATRKEWPLEGVTVRLSHDRIHAEDCESCEEKEGRVDRMARDITLVGPLDDDQRARLLDIADRCPVHRTLKGQTDIPTRLVDG